MTPAAVRKLNPSCDPKNSSIFLGSSAVGSRGEGAPMGTMLMASGRREGGAGGRVRAKESDPEVRGVTTSEEVWAIAGRSDRREESKKRAPQDGGLFWERGVSDFRIYKPSRFPQCD